MSYVDAPRSTSWRWEVRNGDGAVGAAGQLLDWHGKPAAKIAEECAGMLLLRTPESRWREMDGWVVRLWRPGGPDVVLNVLGWLAAVRESRPAA